MQNVLFDSFPMRFAHLLCLKREKMNSIPGYPLSGGAVIELPLLQSMEYCKKRDLLKSMISASFL